MCFLYYFHSVILSIFQHHTLLLDGHILFRKFIFIYEFLEILVLWKCPSIDQPLSSRKTIQVFQSLRIFSHLTWARIISEFFLQTDQWHHMDLFSFFPICYRTQWSPRENDLKRYVLTFPKDSTEWAPIQIHRRKLAYYVKYMS